MTLEPHRYVRGTSMETQFQKDGTMVHIPVVYTKLELREGYDGYDSALYCAPDTDTGRMLLPQEAGKLLDRFDAPKKKPQRV